MFELLTHKHNQPSFYKQLSSHLWDYQPGVKKRSELVKQWKETKLKFAVDASALMHRVYLKD